MSKWSSVMSTNLIVISLGTLYWKIVGCSSNNPPEQIRKGMGQSSLPHTSQAH